MNNEKEEKVNPFIVPFWIYPDQKSLQIINKADFRGDKLLGTLGLHEVHTHNSMDKILSPLSSYEQIKNRVNIWKLLPYISFYLPTTESIPKSNDHHYYDRYLSKSYKSTYSFLRKYHKRLLTIPFDFNGKEKLLSLCEMAESIEKRELELFKNIDRDLTRCGEYYGTINIDVDRQEQVNSERTGYVYPIRIKALGGTYGGFSRNSRDMYPKYQQIPSEWTTNDFKAWFNRFKIQNIKDKNEALKREFYKKNVYDFLPQEVWADVSQHITTLVERHYPNRGVNLGFSLFYSYRNGRLNIRLLKCNTGMHKTPYMEDMHEHIVNAIQDKHDFEITQQVDDYRGKVQTQAFKMVQMQSDLKYMMEHQAFYSNIDGRIKATNTKKFTGRSVSDMFHVGKYSKEYEEINNFIEAVKVHIQMLRDLNSIKKVLDDNNKKRGLNTCIPEVIESKTSTLKFKELVPVQILGDKSISDGVVIDMDNIVKIKELDNFGSNLIGLTGQNAGGKSVVLETIINSLYFAHIGLPVYASSFTFNPRKKIALVFLSRDDGSTMELQINKLGNMFEAFDLEMRQDCYAIIDELGTGTTEFHGSLTPSGGLGFGSKVLNRISSKGYDTIFSTQITDLALYAEKDLKAVIYKLDDHHNMTIGVGKPDLSSLIGRSKLSKYLK